MTTGVYLDAYLAPLAVWLARSDVTDVMVNRPGEVWIETTSGLTATINAPQVTEQALSRLARQIAGATHQGVNREQPLLSAALPDGARVQIVGPPATRGGFVLAVRKHVISDLSLDELGGTGLFETAPGPGRAAKADANLTALLQVQDTAGFLKAAVKARKTIVIAGGAGAGKTTLLNALIKEIDQTERLIVIEDTPEIRLGHHANAVGLLAVRGDQGEARVDAEDLLRASLRLRPDRILLGELRGPEAFAFLRAVNSGHPGSLSSLNAAAASAAWRRSVSCRATPRLDDLSAGNRQILGLSAKVRLIARRTGEGLAGRSEGR
jgi:type IV secretion system protein VirB11